MVDIDPYRRMEPHPDNDLSDADIQAAAACEAPWICMLDPVTGEPMRPFRPGTDPGHYNPTLANVARILTVSSSSIDLLSYPEDGEQ